MVLERAKKDMRNDNPEVSGAGGARWQVTFEGGAPPGSVIKAIGAIATTFCPKKPLKAIKAAKTPPKQAKRPKKGGR